MIDSKALAYELLGPDAEAIDYTLRSGSHSGLRLNFADEADARKFVAKRWRQAYEGEVRLFVGKAQFQTGPGEYSDGWGGVEFDPADGPPEMPDLGDPPPTVLPVFALTGVDTLDVIEFADVGSHNAMFPNGPMSDEQLAELPDKFREYLKRAQDMSSPLNAMRARLGITGDLPWEQTQSGMRHVMEMAPFAITFADPAGLQVQFVEQVSASAASKIAEIIICLAPESYDCPPEDIGRKMEQDRGFRLWWD